MIKKIMLPIAFLLVFSSAAMAQNTLYGISSGYGQGSDSIDIYRIGLMKDWGVQWLKSDSGYVNGYFELSYGRWDGGKDAVNVFALSPVFRYEFNWVGHTVYPYIEAGIGAAYLDEYKIKQRNLSTNLQFEDRIGIGFTYNNLDINFRYMHYSNGSIKEPNDGIDIFMGSFAFYF